eukprot:2334861-Heterocapsa_arctica.AAC.1
MALEPRRQATRRIATPLDGHPRSRRSSRLTRGRDRRRRCRSSYRSRAPCRRSSRTAVDHLHVFLLQRDGE